MVIKAPIRRGLTSDLHALWRLLHSSNQEQEQSLLHVLMSVDLWCDGASQLLIEALLCKPNHIHLLAYSNVGRT